MLLRTGPVLPELVNPELSATKRAAQWRRDGMPGCTRELPLVDVRDLQLRYGPERAYAPKLKAATFTVPLGTAQSTYERVRDAHIGRWLNAMAKQGWDPVLDSGHRVQILPYIYPARDLASGFDDLGARQFIVRAWFTFRSPKPLRLELDPAWVRPNDD